MNILRKHSLPLFAICLFTLLYLTSCRDSTKSEKELQNDLLESEAFYNIHDVEVNNFEIDRRLTDKDNRTDTIYVMATVENDDVTGIQSYVMTYRLYNEGWELDSIERNSEGENYFSPKKGPDNSTIVSQLEDVIGARLVAAPYEITCTGSSAINEETYSATCELETFHTYATLKYPHSVLINFNRETGLWDDLEVQDVGDETVTWDLLGEYVPTKETSTGISGEFDVDYGKVHFTIKSVEDNIITFDISGNNSNGEFESLENCTAELKEGVYDRNRTQPTIGFDTSFPGWIVFSHVQERIVIWNYDAVFVAGSKMGSYHNSFTRVSS